MKETIRTVMTPNPWCIAESAPLSLAATTIIAQHFRHLPVLGGEKTGAGRLVGLIDDALVFARGHLDGGVWTPYDSRDQNLVVGDVASDPRLVMESEEPLALLLQKMAVGNTDCAVIVDRSRHPVGIVTSHDLVRVAPRFLPDCPVTDICTIPALSVSVDQPVAAAFDTMAAHRCRHLLVLDGKAPWAIVSWRDLVERGWDRRLSTTLRDVISPRERESSRGEAAEPRFSVLEARKGARQLETVGIDARLSEVAERMVVQKVGCLPVVGESCEIVGLVTHTDIIASMAAAFTG